MICPPLRMDSVRKDFNDLLNRLGGKEMTADDAVDRDTYVNSLTSAQLDAFDEAHWHFNEHQGDLSKAHEFLDLHDQLTDQLAHHSESQPRSPEGKFAGAPVKAATTGIKHAIVEAERELRGMPIFQKARRAHQQSFDEGVAAVRSGEIDPQTLATELSDPSKRARPISTTESMALLYDRMRIQNDLRAAEAEYERVEANDGDLTDVTKKIGALTDKLNRNDEAAYRAGSEQGRGLAIRREMMQDDYSRAKVMATARRLNKGKDLDTTIQQRLDEITKAHGEMQRKYEEVQQKLDDLQRTAAHQDTVVRFQAEKTAGKGTKQPAVRPKAVIEADVQSLVARLAAITKGELRICD